MKNTKDGFIDLINDVLKVTGTCPNCRSPLYAWKNKKEDGQERCAPTCMRCGYSEIKKQEVIYANETYSSMKQNKMQNYFRNCSICPNQVVFNYTLKSYKANSPETNNALSISNRAAQAVLNGDDIHVVLTGNSGVGKTHLAMGICNTVLVNSDYSKKVLFINYRELLEQLRFAISDSMAYRCITQEIMREIKQADLVAIDDIGAELGEATIQESTRFNSDILYGILESRADRATVFTTNLTSKEISKYYGGRITSRILNNSKGYVISFKNTTDKRISSG